MKFDENRGQASFKGGRQSGTGVYGIYGRGGEDRRGFWGFALRWGWGRKFRNKGRMFKGKIVTIKRLRQKTGALVRAVMG
jgi:hypothetical protein